MTLLFNRTDTLLLEALVVVVLVMPDSFKPIPLIRVPNISFELAKCPLVLLTLIIKSYTFLPLRCSVIGICLNSSPIFEWTLSIPVTIISFSAKIILFDEKLFIRWLWDNSHLVLSL